jgi:hypothetical protein
MECRPVADRIERAIHDFFWQDMCETVCPPPIEEHKEYLNANEFKQNIETGDGIDYAWVWDYAVESFARASSIYKELDDKASDIIKYLGGGTGLFTLAVLTKVERENVGILVWALPSFLAALLSIFFAALARKPNLVLHPPTVKSAFLYAENMGGEGKAQAAFLGCWHVACESMHVAIAIKAKRVQCATWAYVGAIALLLLPMFAAWMILGWHSSVGWSRL